MNRLKVIFNQSPFLHYKNHSSRKKCLPSAKASAPAIAPYLRPVGNLFPGLANQLIDLKQLCYGRYYVQGCTYVAKTGVKSGHLGNLYNNTGWL